MYGACLIGCLRHVDTHHGVEAVLSERLSVAQVYVAEHTEYLACAPYEFSAPHVFLGIAHRIAHVGELGVLGRQEVVGLACLARDAHAGHEGEEIGYVPFEREVVDEIEVVLVVGGVEFGVIEGVEVVGREVSRRILVELFHELSVLVPRTLVGVHGCVGGELSVG